MITILRNQRVLLASTLFLSACFPVHAGTPANKRVAEEPPPWDTPAQTAQSVRQSRHAAAPQPVAAVPARRTEVAANSSGIENWYKTRQSKLNSAPIAVDALQGRASQGDKNAQYELGMLYQGGRGVYQDSAQAREWLLKAANGGHLRAQYALALLLRDSGEATDAQQSLQWQEKSARAGYVEAQYGLGVLYTNGQYTRANAELAHFWFQQAAKRGHEGAKIALVRTPSMVVNPPEPKQVAELGSEQPVQAKRTRPLPTKPGSKGVVALAPSDEELMPEQPEEPAEISVEHNSSKVQLGKLTVAQVKEAAFKGEVDAQLMLGALYEDGSEGVEQNLQEAASWYLKSARQGNPKAQHNLALLYEDGRGMKQDYGQAAFWYKKAAAAGFSEAQNNLAVLYLTGNGVPEDIKKAEELLTEAVAAGNTNAERNLDMLREQMG